MPAEGWWDALWEGRLQVRGYYHGFRVKVPKGTPSWRKVAKLVARAVEKGKLIPGTVVNRIAYGLVRVTFHGKWEDRYKWYTAIQPVLERRYKVTERYEHGPKYHAEMVAAADKLGEDPVVRASLDVWFEVAPKDGPYPPVSPAREMHDKALISAIEGSKGGVHGRREVCNIAWAFIREDARQATLPLGGPNYTGWGNSPTVEGEKEKLLTAIAKASEYAKVWERYLSLPKGEAEKELLKDIDFSVLRGEECSLENTCYYLKCDYGWEGMSRQVKDMMGLRAKGEATPEQMDRLVQAVAEYAVIRAMPHVVCIAPHPTHGGPQDGAWEAHKAFHNAMAPVIASADPYPSEEDDEGEEKVTTHDEGKEPEEEEEPASEVSDEEVTHADESPVE
jgi:hypothetical protein